MTSREPGTEIAGYRIESLIGRGGMAAVYRAEDMRLGRKVALKLLTPQLADSEQFRQRFIRESRLAASLDHPNIVPIYEAGEADGQLFIAMRYVIGADLKGVLAEQGGQLPLAWTLAMFSQIGNALDAAHRAGLVHRDVKPGNILVAAGERAQPARGGHVYLTDFGLTKRTSELSGGLTGTGHFLGTVDYVSPEQIQGHQVGPGTDIYALGCVLYQCLTGRLPFHRDDDAALLWAHLVETPPPVTGIRPEVPPGVDAVVTRAMAKDPEARYPSCEEFLNDLELALGGPMPRSATTRHAGMTTDLSGPSPGGVGYSLAIDLGTSFVAASVADDRGLEMFGLGDGSLVEPAAVYIRDNGGLVTGDAAARRAVSNPDRVAREIKRNLGNPTPVMLGGAPYDVSDLLGALLQDVLVRVAERQGAKPDVVALTHPANWGPFRRGLFQAVAQAAGLTDPLYTTEPEAAAAHFASTRPLGEGDVLAVYDLGGGTFDATVLRRTAQGFEIVGTPEGIERLGGADFDEAIFGHVNYVAGGALTELDHSDPKTVSALARLRQDCTLAKEALSVDVEATIPVFLPNRHFEVTLTRTELEGMIRAPIESTIGTLDRVLRAAQVDPTTLVAVLLVGGSSRIPLVAQMVSEAFGRPTVVGAHPKHAVSLGAALLAEARRRKVPEGRLADADAGQTAAASVVADSRPAAPVSRETPPSEAEAGWPAADPAAASVASPVAVADVPAPADVEPVGLVPEPRVGEPGSPPTGEPPGWAPVGAPPTGWLGEPPTGEPPGWAPAGVPPTGWVGEPTDGAPPPVPPAAKSARWRTPWLAFIVGLLALAAVGASVLVYLNLRPENRLAANQASTSPPTSSAPASETPATAPAAPAVATAVPIPTLGPTIHVGQSPNFVVASPNGRQLYVASPTARAIYVVDTAADQVTATIAVSAGPPQFLAFSPDGRTVYISVWDDARTIAAVNVLDATTLKITATIPVKTRPFLGAVSPDGKRVFVPNHDTGTVSVIDTSTDKLITDFSVPPNPHYVAFTPDGSKAYIANHESNVVSVVDASTYAVLATIPVPESPHSVIVHPKRPLAFVASYNAASVTAIDTNTNKAIATIPVEQNPQHVAWSADGRFVYVTNDGSNSVSVIDVDSLTVTARIPTGASPTSMAVLPDGSRGYVSNLEDGTLTELNLAG